MKVHLDMHRTVLARRTSARKHRVPMQFKYLTTLNVLKRIDVTDSLLVLRMPSSVFALRGYGETDLDARSRAAIGEFDP